MMRSANLLNRCRLVTQKLGSSGLPLQYGAPKRLIVSNNWMRNQSPSMSAGAVTKRSFSGKSDGDEESGKQSDGFWGSDDAAPEADGESSSSESKEEEKESEQQAEPEQPLEAAKKEAATLKDQLLRALAEQENIRAISRRDIEKERNFATSKMAKSLLDVSDNLSRALEAVPEDMRADKEGHPVLASLYEGITMTEKILHKSFNANGIKKFGEVGEQFDPNLHDAMFEYEEEGKEAGSIGQIMKVSS